VCDTTDQQSILDAFRRCYDVCGEFLARQRRIKKYHELVEAINYKGSAEAMRDEYGRYAMLTSEVPR
jgi:hypothetical protein